jgi:3-oxoadipate enol-lactonase
MSNPDHIQTGFAEINGTTLYYEVAGLITKGESYSDRQDLYALMHFLGIESAYLMGVSEGGALALDFTLEHPEMVDALILITAGVSGFRPSEEEMKKHPDVVGLYASLEEAFEKHDMARAVEISLALWTDGPGRLGAQAAPEVPAHNWERPDDGAQAQTPPVPLEPPALRRLSEIGVPTLVVLDFLGSLQS